MHGMRARWRAERRQTAGRRHASAAFHWQFLGQSQPRVGAEGSKSIAQHTKHSKYLRHEGGWFNLIMLSTALTLQILFLKNDTIIQGWANIDLQL